MPFFFIHTEFLNSKEAIDFFKQKKNLGQRQNNKKSSSFHIIHDDDEIALSLSYVNARSLNFQFVRESSMETEESETHGRKGEKKAEK